MTEVQVPKKFEKLVNDIEGLSVIELNELVGILEEKFGVSRQVAAVATASASDAGSGDDDGGAVNVELTDAGAQKIQVIKVVKEALGLGLKEAKDLVDGAPAMLKEGMDKKDADELKAKIEGAGGKIAVK